MLINLLCGVQKPRDVVPQCFPSSTPHNYGRHITHQMWCTTFDAGNLHVRFDERRLETEPWREPMRHRQAKAAGHQLPSRPTATAPVVDSTRGAWGVMANLKRQAGFVSQILQFNLEQAHA